MHQKSWSATSFCILGVLLMLIGTTQSFGSQKKREKEQEPPQQPEYVQKRYVVEGGVMVEKKPLELPDSVERPIYSAADSLLADRLGYSIEQFDSARRAEFALVKWFPDSIAAFYLGSSVEQYDSLKRVTEQSILADEVRLAREAADTTVSKAVVPVTWEEKTVLTKRQERRKLRAEQDADPNFVRYSKIFRDTVPLSKLAWMSVVIPGLSQVHNKQLWKLPILYGVTAASAIMWQRENKVYKPLKKEYDFMVSRNVPQAERDHVQSKMIRSNTKRQLWMAATIGTYIYFIADGAINYPGTSSTVKKATTLSTIFPGAGQIYNGSYWKVPIVVGGFAGLAYVIDWNNRGYKRMQTAIRALTSDDPYAVDEFGGRLPLSTLSNAKRNYRRNRDLAIIITGAFYILNIIDAHVDAHLRDYDISDDLSMQIAPTIEQFSSFSRGNSHTFGMTLCVKF